ncbi:hypothetical protein FB45DRAFT_748624, partial [Roridomyces roridus]
MDQLQGPTKTCGCSCIPNCNCNCTCACEDHCVCRLEPCVGNCRARVSRNLVVSIDGTSKQFGVYNTNVVELHGHIDPKAEQHKYYHPGIGSYVPNEGQSAMNRFGEWIGTTIDLAIARNLKVNILEAYKWLSQMYHHGDKIFIFGFSRGAYQARALTAMIERVGLVDRGNESMIPYPILYVHTSICVTGTRGKERKKARRDEIARNFKSTFSRDIRIHFTGVWDTVSSVGIIYGNLLPLTSSAQHICIFRHALALDEQRVRFLPEYVAGSAQGSEITSLDVKEAWFPGTHSDMQFQAGLRLLPRKAGGEWETTDLRRNDIHKSLTGLWKVCEYLPLKHLSFQAFGEHTRQHSFFHRALHRGDGRTIVPGQRVHISVAFKNQKEYIPRAK